MAVKSLLSVGLLASGAAAAATVGHLFPDCAKGPLSNNTVCNTSAGITERARALVAAFTNEEKFDLVNNASPGVPRLGLPSYQWWLCLPTEEALHGLASSPGVTFNTNRSQDYSSATSFPQPILMGAAFDDALIRAVATVVSTEARAYNNTPNINPYRDPRWGRGQETPGEDAFHIKSYVKALIRGLQGEIGDKYIKVVATCKHFAGYDIENWAGNERYAFNAVISPQELNEYFMQPFQACARDARVASIMCSYNALNGVPTCADSYILQDVLREHWDWQEEGFYVTSDCDSIQNIYSPHNYTDTRESSAAAALVAGTDLDCGTYYQLHLPEAYKQGLFNDSIIDQALVRLYSAQIRLGMFDSADGQPYRALTYGDVNTKASQALALRAAEEGIVLIKNDGLLPLSIPANGNTTIAVIGGWANATTTLQGNYAGIAPFLRSPLMAVKDIPGVSTTYYGSPGDPTTDGYPPSLAAAKAADIIIYADGSNSGESNDRNLIRWSGERPLHPAAMGDQLDDTPFLNHPNVSAILWAGFPGQSGGDAIVNILTGKTAPAGRLPVTQYPEHYVDEVPMTDMSLRPNATTGNPGRTYMWYNQSVVDFGFGLHYTNFATSVESSSSSDNSSSSFAISDLTKDCHEKYPDLCPFRTVPITVRTVPITVRNTGNVTSDFVTLGFMAGAHGPEPRPIKKLVAYERLFAVAGGASATAHLNLTLGSLGRHSEAGDLVVYPGEYSLLVDVPTQAMWNFTLTGDELTLEQWPQGPQQRAYQNVYGQTGDVYGDLHEAQSLLF
ncbi:beta-glucosidase [Microdochium trichocladiopsis]|uniref:xylan 1,4-beta-xylosidase n=1 Tax=Microdochium trichocladiopsis TaxID=1682393 RepID=A0A9P8Y5J2_9PEZI|nr:beta-glucosidase [Microdochium trichocladiopsis]KAH7029764.1 beta-glucosidase [Microdochium trichocladiopsis]